MAASTHYWWEGDVAERYWCEITARKDIGSDLHCPQLDERGLKHWSYSLITQIRPGELVYHYSIPRNAFIGVSRAASRFTESTTEWVPHSGLARRNDEQVTIRPAWRVPLASFTPSDQPLTLQDVRRDQKWVRDWIEAKSKDGAVAAPFQLYPGSLRANQGYLTKMPSAFVGRWPQLSELARRIETETLEAESGFGPRQKESRESRNLQVVTNGSGQGFQISGAIRSAIEEYAVALARRHFVEMGFDVQIVGKPYDLKCLRERNRVFVEVKGTTTLGDKVILTPNEVAFAEDHKDEMALFVVSNIRIDDVSAEKPIASGGDIRILSPFRIDTNGLEPIAFFYRLRD